MIFGAKTVPRNYANKNTTYENNGFMRISGLNRKENVLKNAIKVS